MRKQFRTALFSGLAEGNLFTIQGYKFLKTSPFSNGMDKTCNCVREDLTPMSFLGMTTVEVFNGVVLSVGESEEILSALRELEERLQITKESMAIPLKHLEQNLEQALLKEV